MSPKAEAGTRYTEIRETIKANRIRRKRMYCFHPLILTSALVWIRSSFNQIFLKDERIMQPKYRQGKGLKIVQTLMEFWVANISLYVQYQAVCSCELGPKFL